MRKPWRDRFGAFPHPYLSTPYLEILLCLDYNVARTVARRAGASLLTASLTVPARRPAYAALRAIGRPMRSPRAPDWRCAILLTRVTYPHRVCETGRFDYWPARRLPDQHRPPALQLPLPPIRPHIGRGFSLTGSVNH
jgi:hypothetical protein